MCILSLYADREKISKMKERCVSNPQGYPKERRESLLQGAVELGLLFKGRYVFRQYARIPVDSLYDIWHSESIQVAGEVLDLYRLTELGKIDDGKLEAIVSLIFNADFTNYDIKN